MSQHDLILANQSGSSFRADLNLALPALVSNSSGASAPATTYAYQWWFDTTTATMKQRNAANSAWIMRGSLQETFVLSRSSNTILNVDDRGRTIRASSSFTQTFTACATLGDGWYVHYVNEGSGTITLDPNASETIDGGTTITLERNESVIIFCNGSNLSTIGRSALLAASQAEQESGALASVFVTPARQQLHRSAAKWWALWNSTGTTLLDSYNVTSITNSGTGDESVTINTDFSSANWVPFATANTSNSTSATAGRHVTFGTILAGAIQFLISDGENPEAFSDAIIGAGGFGDQS